MDSSGTRLLLHGAARCALADGRCVELEPKDALLLAYLALEGPTSRARLAAMLWPDAETGRARAALRQRLVRLRRSTGFDLVNGNEIAALALGVSLDSEGGDTLLPTIDLDDDTELAGWLTQQRSRRLAARCEHLAEAARRAEDEGELDAALAYAQALLELDATSEHAHRRVIRLHYLRGDRAAALAAYARCRAALERELGVAPSPETEALRRQLDAALPQVASRRAVPIAVLRPPRLVGRDEERARIQEAWSSARVSLLAGEGGLGKSRLLADFAEEQGEGLISVGARPGDALLPYALLSRLLRALLARTGMALAPGVRGELARLLPELGEAPPAQGGAEGVRFANAVEATLVQAAGHGVTGVLIDDLHLSDTASAELLLALCAQSALPWVLAFRNAELAPATRALADELLRSQRAQPLVLAPLGLAQVAELLASLGIESIAGAETASQLHRRTGGNPLYLLETVKTLLAGSAEAKGRTLAASTVGQLILQRIHALSPGAVKLARCAAVAGQDFSAALASAVLQTAALDLADPWNELEAAQVLRDGAFAHDLIYEAAHASVPVPIARELHLQIARFLEGRGGDPARIAAHWLAGGEPRSAVAHLQAAAALMRQRLRYLDAARGYEQAARILEGSGEPQAAFDAWYLAAEAAARLEDRGHDERYAQPLEALAETDAQRAKAAFARSRIALEAGDFERVAAAAQRGLVHARRAALSELESDLIWQMAVVHWERREVAQAVVLAEQALAIRRALPPHTLRPGHVRELINMTQGLGTLLGAAGRFAEGMLRLTEAHRLGVDAGDTHAVLGCAGELCWRASESGDLPAALQWAERGLQAAGTEEPSADALATLWSAGAHALLLAGRWGDALAQYETLLERVQRSGLGRRLPAAAAAMAEFLGLLGRRDLGVKAVQPHLGGERLSELQRLGLDLALLSLGERRDVPALLERILAVEDKVARARMLVKLAPHAEPATLLGLLTITATTLRDGGLLGLWITLQARMAALLAAAGRDRDAAAVARGAWLRAEAGCAPTLPFAEFAADLRCALAVAEPELARTIGLRGLAWLQSAAVTLPAAWRDNCLARSPLRTALSLPPRRSSSF